jgi:hypothetical protein
VRVDVAGLPDDVRTSYLSDEVMYALDRILKVVADEFVPGLVVATVEFKEPPTRSRRGLAKNVRLYYNVNALKDDDRQFGPAIIDAMRENREYIWGLIYGFGGWYIKDGVDLNFCIPDGAGEYSDCVKTVASDVQFVDLRPTSSPTRVAWTTGSPVSHPTASPTASNKQACAFCPGGLIDPEVVVPAMDDETCASVQACAMGGAYL